MKLLISIRLLSIFIGFSLLADEQSDREAYKRKLERMEKLEKSEKLCNEQKTEESCFKKPSCIWIVHKTMCQFRGEVDYKNPKRPNHTKGSDE